MDPVRRSKLRGLYAKILAGKEQLGSKNAKQFLEAVISEEDPGMCIQRLNASATGLGSLRTALASDTSLPFLNGIFTSLIRYVQTPEVVTICGGYLVQQLASSIVEVEVTWNAYVEAAACGRLSEDALDALSSFLVEILSSQDAIPRIIEAGQNEKIRKRMLAHSTMDVRLRARKIAHIIEIIGGYKSATVNGPGGRHDNDFEDIHAIHIMPTAEELASKDPYLPRVQDMDNPQGATSLAAQVDRQFRLLREDMISDLREELGHIKAPNKSTVRKRLRVFSLSLAGALCDDKRQWSLQFECLIGLPQIDVLPPAKKKKFIKENTNYLKDDSVGCLMVADQFLSLATICRDEALLNHQPPILCLRIPESSVENVISKARSSLPVSFIQLNTPLFSYEPILKQLKAIRNIPLAEELFAGDKNCMVNEIDYKVNPSLQSILEQIEKDAVVRIDKVLSLSREIRLDKSQAQCFLAGARQKVCTIQGPPGTGKSFMGSLIAKSILHFSNEKILVVCYTHHALDQFLEELLDLGIPDSDIVRLGSTKKATIRAKPLSLQENPSSRKLTPIQFNMLQKARAAVTQKGRALRQAVARLQGTNFSKSEVLEHLEFRSEGPSFFEAFEVPLMEGKMTQVGKSGRTVDKFYLLDQWRRGKDAGIFQRSHGSRFPEVWNLKAAERFQIYEQWKREMMETVSELVCGAGEAYNKALAQVRAIYMEKDLEVMRQKRIIACTTTAAAKYVKHVQSVSPGVVLVEEAGEILESHILTAIGPDTKQLILVGDHKQLRPKISNYNLTVEKGEGYDLNRSLFERLVLEGFPHQVLVEQHRMRPELSAILRELTYPELCDAPKTKGRPDLRGCTDNLIFVDHRHPEVELADVREWGDGYTSSSKKNLFEGEMTWKCVRYLGQQGYRTDNIVVLTPYLGQLRLLMDLLSQSTDPVLNDLDSYDLVRAGLMPEASAAYEKPKIRLSTIDNFQGDESDIVIVCLTRSNTKNDIGFLFSPERVNVLLSRARNALIIIGNSETFMGSAKGGELWRKVLGIFKKGMHIYEGLPVRCQQHPAHKAILKLPDEFDEKCPDGGCNKPCETTLNCGVHKCPQRCHQLFDHSKIPCQQILEIRCKNDHLELRKCHQLSRGKCSQCKDAEEREQRRLKHDLDIQERRTRLDALHADRMEKIDQQIQSARDVEEERQLQEDREKALQQRQRDLEDLQQSLSQEPPSHVAEPTTSTTGEKPGAPRTPLPKDQVRPSQPPNITWPEPPPTPEDSPEFEWQRQKRVENATNDAIDAIMAMAGLKEVKIKILAIKAKTDIVKRQKTDMKKERLGMVMLGNPGTGKTTVARHYAKFLTSVGALRGSGFVEATGSSLANEGVAGTKKHIESLMKSGGGVFFLDEAYQLTSGNSFGGGAVLDFLLAEIEERIGSIVFVFAGYTKEMEKFFEHNPGLDSRLPHRLVFADYSNVELLTMLEKYVDQKYAARASFEDGPRGLYARILVDRLGANRGRPGFGNARSLHNTWSRVSERQAQRLVKERKDGLSPDDLFFSKEDLIGPQPKGVIQTSAAWRELQSMVGLKQVKESINTLVGGVEKNYHRELAGKPPIQVSLNRIFIGNPGTGKTSVGRLYAAILAELGLLSKNEVVLKLPSDFVGAHLGESEKNTKAILRTSEGKVLLIDEAYGLFAGGGVGKGQADIYKAAVIDTIVGEVQNTPGEDRCVLLLGYEDKMKEMLDNSNPGLARRFPISEAFHFDDFGDEELRQILDFKLKKQGLDATDEAKDVCIGILSKTRDRPNFGNAGEVENLIGRAKAHHQARSQSSSMDNEDPDVLFLPQDFDPDFNRASRSGSICSQIFGNLVGAQEWTGKFERLQRMALNMKGRGQDPKDHIAFNWIFKGPPGTGKTTVAQKVAEFYYEIGILSTKEYVECSASDLIAQYVGQSGPKTREVLTKALGKVLFIDEAYRLSDGPFGKEAVDELVDCVTKPQFKGKVVIILAGYSNDIDRLLNVNRGLASRFPEELIFEPLKPDSCLELLEKELGMLGVMMSPACRAASSRTHSQLVQVIDELTKLPSWGNARDIITISKKLIALAFEGAEDSFEPLVATEVDILKELSELLTIRKDREANKAMYDPSPVFQMQDDHSASKPSLSPNINASDNTAILENVISADHLAPTEESEPPNANHRDPGVSDATWTQLQRDIAAQLAAQNAYQATVLDHERTIMELETSSNESASKIAELEHDTSASQKDQETVNELKRKREEERLQQLDIKRRKREKEETLRRIKEAEEARKKCEAEAQKKLKMMGVCVAGFRWVKQNGGYRCAGGSHFVTDSQLGLAFS
ncbi:hypothetical protein AYO22_05023 [Fonsecaea multimorphosa]|nr:hypothetical protein AYO22_05023 [Fonsecaea multimorphosa]